MWPKTALTELLGTTYPIVQAPMASISTAAMVAAVSAAGGLGSLGSALMPPDAVATEVAAVRARTDRPFALNFFVHAPPRIDEAVAARVWRRMEGYRRELGLAALPLPPLVAPPPFGAAMLEQVLALRPPVVSFHFGLPDEAALRAVKGAGIVVLATATTVGEARILEARGADAIIAQGQEAGGHRGTFAAPFADGQIGTLALVPQVVDAVAVPVIAAGGLFDGRGIAATRHLGAAGAQLGTAFLGTPEAAIDPIYRRTLGEPRAAQTRITTVLSGRPARAILTRFIAEMADMEEQTADFPLQRVLTLPLALASVSRGDPECHAMWAGQSAAQVRALPAGELLTALAHETDVVMNGGARR